MLKKIIYCLILFLLLPANIYLAYYFFATHGLTKELTALDGDSYRILSYEQKSIVDYNKDFIPDIIMQKIRNLSLSTANISL